MSSYSFLVGLPNKKPIFSTPGGENEIAYATDWVPLGWLALFEPRDVQVVEEPPDSETYDPETRTRCPTLIRKREAALDSLRRRKARLAKVLPPHLQPQLSGLERAVAASPHPYIQTVVSDLDMFASFPGSERELRNYVAAMDSDKADDWRAVLALVDTEMGKDFSKVEFSDMTGVAAVVGYLPEEFAVSLSGKPVSAEKAAAAAAAAAAKAKKKPWWKFW
jgi:hypothetical protein